MDSKNLLLQKLDLMNELDALFKKRKLILDRHTQLEKEQQNLQKSIKNISDKLGEILQKKNTLFTALLEHQDYKLLQKKMQDHENIRSRITQITKYCQEKLDSIATPEITEDIEQPTNMEEIQNFGNIEDEMQSLPEEIQNLQGTQAQLKTEIKRLQETQAQLDTEIQRLKQDPYMEKNLQNLELLEAKEGMILDSKKVLLKLYTEATQKIEGLDAKILQFESLEMGKVEGLKDKIVELDILAAKMQSSQSQASDSTASMEIPSSGLQGFIHEVEEYAQLIQWLDENGHFDPEGNDLGNFVEELNTIQVKFNSISNSMSNDQKNTIRDSLELCTSIIGKRFVSLLRTNSAPGTINWNIYPLMKNEIVQKSIQKFHDQQELEQDMNASSENKTEILNAPGDSSDMEIENGTSPKTPSVKVMEPVDETYSLGVMDISDKITLVDEKTTIGPDGFNEKDRAFVSGLERQLGEARDKLKSLDDKILHLCRDFDKHIKLSKESANELGNLQNEINRISNEGRKKFKLKIRSNKSLSSEKNSMETNKAMLQSLQETIKEKTDFMGEQVDIAQKSQEELDKEVAECEQQIQQCKNDSGDNQDADCIVEILQNDLENLNKRKKNFAELAALHKKEIEVLHAREEELKNKTQRFEENIAEKNQYIGGLDSEIKFSHEKIDELRVKIDNESREYNDLKRQINEILQQEQSDRNQTYRLLKKIRSLEKQISDIHAMPGRVIRIKDCIEKLKNCVGYSAKKLLLLQIELGQSFISLLETDSLISLINDTAASLTEEEKDIVQGSIQKFYDQQREQETGRSSEGKAKALSTSDTASGLKEEAPGTETKQESSSSDEVKLEEEMEASTTLKSCDTTDKKESQGLGFFDN